MGCSSERMPVRINDTTVNVHASGLADGSYRLVADRAKFNSGSQYTAVALDQGTGGAAMYGDIPSSTMDDATLSLQTVGGTTLCSTNFTVLWVDISMRCGQGDALSPDNNLAANFGSNLLGCNKQTNVTFLDNGQIRQLADMIGNAAEFAGRVMPSDFQQNVKLVRDCVGEYEGYLVPGYSLYERKCETAIPRGQEPNVNDPSPDCVRDDDPRPMGVVYDVDTPGLQMGYGVAGGMNPTGTIIIKRLNFLQFAIFGRKRCSNDFSWYSRTTVIKTSSPGSAYYDFHNRPGTMFDNSLGTGLTTISAD